MVTQCDWQRRTGDFTSPKSSLFHQSLHHTAMEQRKSSRPTPIPCDQCRRRKIKCNYSTPSCQRCSSSHLECTYTSVRKKRGPKTGKGVVVDQLRAASRAQLSPSTGCQALSIQQLVSSNTVTEDGSNHSNAAVPESYFSFDEFAQYVLSSSTLQTLCKSATLPQQGERIPSSSMPPTRTNATACSAMSHVSPPSIEMSGNEPVAQDLAEQGVKLFFEFLHPVYPVLAKKRLDEMVKNPTSLSPSESCLIWSICAMTLMQVERWPTLSLQQRVSATRRYIRRCKEARLDMDFTEIATFHDVLCSLFIGMALFELKCRKASWFYVREAITLSSSAGLQQVEHDMTLEYDERLRRKRAYALMFVTERGACVLDIFPVSILQVPSLPHVSCADEDPSIAAGLQGLYNLFSMLDFNFVRLWNDSSRFMSIDKGYPELRALQDCLSQPMHLEGVLEIQRADVLITQQWLRLIFWQAALRGGLISTAATHSAFSYEFPLEIASSLCKIIRSLPPIAIQVHGLGIFEKQFEIAYSLLDTLNLSDTAQPPEHHENLRFLLLSLSASPSSRQLYVKTLERKMGESGPRKYRYLGGVQLLRDDSDSPSLPRRHPGPAGPSGAPD